jgi:hypothetical protein
MNKKRRQAASLAALAVLKSNFDRQKSILPRTAGFGYPEPYTRDLMIATLGIAASGDPDLIHGIGEVLKTLAANQSPRGHIPSLADEPNDRGESDTTPLFLIGLAVYRQMAGKPRFLEEAADRALGWLAYQSPGDRVIVAQQPTSDWRDEQWVLGYGLYVNTLLYAALRLFGRHEHARILKEALCRPIITRGWMKQQEHEGLALEDKPYFALWSYKVLYNDRFDLLGNSLAILTGIASLEKSLAMIEWVEKECRKMQREGVLALPLPPNLFPFIEEHDPDWQERYATYNQKGEYHNGGIWPFVTGFYIAALVAAGAHSLAKQKLDALTRVVSLKVDSTLAHGFNEWIRADNGLPKGVDWQTWSAAMYLYAEQCVNTGTTPLFDDIRNQSFRT